MEAYLSILSGCPLFAGLTSAEIEKILGCMKAEPIFRETGTLLFREGDLLPGIVILLSGSVSLSRPGFERREEFGKISPGGIIGLESVLLPERLGFSVTADCDAAYIILDPARLTEPCASVCGCHVRMIRSLMCLLAESAARDADRTVHLTRRTTREKLLSYLANESARQKLTTFEIPLDRRALAAYLAVDRSAMSNELSKLRAEGLIDFTRNRFTLNINNK